MTDVEAAKRLRSTAKGKFTRAANNLDQAIDTGAPTKTVKNRYGELKAAWNETNTMTLSNCFQARNLMKAGSKIQIKRSATWR